MWQVVCGFQTEILKITNQEDLARDGNMKRRAEWNRTSERVCSPACLRATGLSSDHRVALEQGRILLFPIVNADAIEAPLFRVLVQRRLRLPLPLRVWRHVLGQGCWEEEDLLWKAHARDCREAGGRVATNLFVRNMDLGVPRAGDNKLLEVVVDGFHLFGGAQLVVDTTLVSALKGNGEPRCRPGRSGFGSGASHHRENVPRIA